MISSMRKTIVPALLIFILLVGGYLFYDFKINKPKTEYYKNLSPKDLDPESFITLFSERYNKGLTNFVTLSGEFPENWVKANDIQYLISIMHSKQKCCGYMNIFSSHISNDNAEVGGFAIIFLNSYISQTKIKLGLNCNPKVDLALIKKNETWYQKQMK